MMRAGRDYATKSIPEYEDRRGAHLRELIGTMASQGAIDPSTDVEADAAIVQPAEKEIDADAEGKVKASMPQKSMSNKPVLKLR